MLDAEQCVRIATLGGAEALGLADDVGSLEAGKLADLIAVDVSSSHFVPIDDPYSALVYGANQDDVLFTCVGGESLYATGGSPRLDADAIRAEGRRCAPSLQDRVARGPRAGRRRRIRLVAHDAARPTRGRAECCSTANA